ncbi:MAG: hypothetical protein KF716_08730 [Anaerolineae bacterium]|nr:hypothetical protein [Anaerolineae bacterium]
MPTLIAESIMGPNAAVQLALPTGVDGASVLQFQLRSGQTAAQMIARLAAAIGIVNQDVAETFAGMYSMTDAPYANYVAGTGSRTKTPKKAEYNRGRSVRGDEAGGMLPLDFFEEALEWTEQWLRDARQMQIDSDTNLIVENWRARVLDDFLTRIFSNAENQITSTGYDVPWAISSGVSVPYIPPQNKAGNDEFTAAHTHFHFADSQVTSTAVKAMLKLLVGELRHHSHSGRLSALVSDADVDAYVGMGKEFVELQPPQFQVVAGNSNAPVNITSGEVQGIPGELFGYYKGPKGVVELRYHDRIPSGYQFLTKPYGSNDIRNGLAVRTHPDYGFGLRLDPKGNGSLVNPKLEFIVVEGGHGIGINNRTNGACGFIASGATQYVSPSFN